MDEPLGYSSDGHHRKVTEENGESVFRVRFEKLTVMKYLLNT